MASAPVPPVPVPMLRQRLASVCSELRFLTNADLEAPSSKTKRTCFDALFLMLESRLAEENVDLARLREARDMELKRHRLGGLGGEDEKLARKESELTHRSRHTALILRGLEKLHWPPTRVAFANVNSDLAENATTFYDACLFLAALIAPLEKKQVLQEHGGRRPSSSSTSAIMMRTTMADREAFGSPLISRSLSARAEAKDSPPLPVSARSTAKSRERAVEEDADADDFDLLSLPTAGSVQSMAGETREPLQTSFAILQFHNEMLSRQLKLLQESVCARDQAEARMDSILLDLKAAIDEVADLGMSNSGGETSCTSASATPLLSSPYLASDPAQVTQAEDDLFRTEVNKEAAVAEAKRRIASGLVNGAGRGKGIYSGSGKDYDEIQKGKLPTSRAAKACAPPSTGVTSTIIWSKLQIRVQGIHNQWDGARREARGAILRPLEVHRECNRNAVASPKKSTHRLPSEVRIHQVLGVKAPLTLISKTDSSYNLDPATEHWLDVARIHQLQRDLVAFAQSAFTLTHSPATLAEEEGISQLEKLRVCARELTLHLACFSPLAPLALDSPYSSSLTGLEALIQEADKLVKSTGKIGRTHALPLQVAADRAKAEFFALAMVRGT